MYIDLVVYLVFFCVVMTVYFIIAIRDTPCYRYVKRKCCPRSHHTNKVLPLPKHTQSNKIKLAKPIPLQNNISDEVSE